MLLSYCQNQSFINCLFKKLVIPPNYGIANLTLKTQRISKVFKRYVYVKVF